jgi:hypothetical protein
VKLNELNLNQMFGDYGAAAMKQAGNRLTGKAEGNLSVQDKIAKDKFISDFIGRASTNLNSAIQSGLVDPNIKAGAAGAVEPQQDATPEPSADTTPQQPATSTAPKTPAEIQKEKLAAAAKVAQDQMANSPAPAKPSAPTAPKSPEQTRQEKQAAATQTAQSQMFPTAVVVPPATAILAGQTAGLTENVESTLHFVNQNDNTVKIMLNGLTDGTITLVSASGQTVSTGKTSSDEYIVNLNGLTAGVYVINAEFAAGRTTKKVIVH